MISKRLACMAAAVAPISPLALAQPADAIWFNGPIVTIDERRPAAEAVAVRNGLITGVGTRDDVMKLKSPKTRMIDLQGRTLLPGFIDGHGHISMVGLQAVSANLLPPPDGPNGSVSDVQKTLRDFMQASATPKKFGILFGFGYDDGQLKEQRHPTREELDAVTTEIPIIAIHQSGHLATVNSKALQLAGITAATKNPDGGVIQRRDGTQEPNGTLEELAFFGVLLKLMPKLTQAQQIAMLEEAQNLFLRYGYTTIQDGRAQPNNVLTAIAAAKQGRLKADVVSYPDVLQIGKNTFMTGQYYKPTYTNHFRIGGVKLTLDGSPQGKTAWLTKPYFKPPTGQPSDYAGYGVVPEQQAIDVYTLAFRNKWQIMTHANGDRAIDEMISAMEVAARNVPGTDRRPVLIHGQTLREDQVDKIQNLGILPSLFPMHTFYWGDWHRESVLGPERAENISPTGWLVKRGMTFTSHHDAPVAFPDSIRILSSTVNRTTRTGYVLGPEHRVEPEVALKALTLRAAIQHFEEKRKGSIVVGKLADFVVLSGNPMTVKRSTLYDLKVLETIKQGRTIWRADEAKRASAPAACAESMRCFESLTRFVTVFELRQRLIASRGG